MHSCHKPCRAGGVGQRELHKATGQTWSRRSGSNRRPTAYKAVALPLSYTGRLTHCWPANRRPDDLQEPDAADGTAHPRPSSVRTWVHGDMCRSSRRHRIGTRPSSARSGPAGRSSTDDPPGRSAQPIRRQMNVRSVVHCRSTGLRRPCRTLRSRHVHRFDQLLGHREVAEPFDRNVERSSDTVYCRQFAELIGGRDMHAPPTSSGKRSSRGAGELVAEVRH